MAFNITADSNGDGEATKKLVSDIIIGNAVAFKKGNFDSVEFFALYVYTRKKESDDPTSGDGGGTGFPGHFILSPPKLTGRFARRGDELVVKVEAGVANATSDYRVLIPYQAVG